MIEYLNIISDTINDLNKEKERIESKKTKTKADEEEIEAIEALYENLATRLEGWLKNKKQNQPSYQPREEVYIFEDSKPKDTFKELDTIITGGIDEEKKAKQLAEIDRLIAEELAGIEPEKETNEFVRLNESIYEGMQEEKQSDELDEKIEEVNRLINNGMTEKTEKNELSNGEETKEESIDEELGAMLRQFFEEEAEEKKEKPLKNFVTKIKKRITLPKKLNKEKIVTGMKSFCKKCVPSFMKKKENDMSHKKMIEEKIAKKILLENENEANGYEELLPRELNYEYLEDELLSDFEEAPSFEIIGSTVSIYEGTRVYNNALDSYIGKNSYPTYYGDEEERVIIGVAIVNDTDTGIQGVYANEEDYQEKIDLLLENGGNIVSVLTANKKYLSDWDGKTPLLWEEIKAYGEGWCDINDISNQNTKGLSR